MRSDEAPTRQTTSVGDAALAAMPFVVVAALLMLMVVAGMRSDEGALRQRALEVDAAVAAAEAKLQELRGRSPDRLVDGADTVRLDVDHAVQRSWRVRASYPEAGLWTLDVEITRLRHAAPPVRLSFVVAERPS